MLVFSRNLPYLAKKAVRETHRFLPGGFWTAFFLFCVYAVFYSTSQLSAFSVVTGFPAARAFLPAITKLWFWIL